jgi:anti-anti-sigma factor
VAGIYTIRPTGDIDAATAGPLREELHALVQAEHPDHLVIDLRDVTFMDSAGLSVLIRIRKQQMQHGGDVTVVNPIPRVNRIMKITGLDAVFAPAPATADAAADTAAGS